MGAKVVVVVGGLAAALVSGGAVGQTAQAATSWSPVTRLGTSTSPISLAADGSGDAVAAFSQTPNGGVGTVYVARRPVGQAWGSASAVPLSSSYDSSGPSIALDASGAEVGLFRASQIDGYPSADVAFWGLPSGWGRYDVVALPSSPLPALVRSYGSSTTAINDTVAVVSGAKGCILSAEMNPSYTYWQNEGVITTACVKSYDFALDRSGNGVVGYVTTGGSVAIATRSPGGVWSTPTVVASVSLSSHVSVADSADGTATVVYSSGKTGKKSVSVWASRLTAPGTWSVPTRLSASACSLSVASAVSAAGATVAGWVGASGAECDPLAATDSGAGYAPAMAATGQNASSIALVETGGGSTVAAWNDARSRASKAAVGSPSGFGTAATIGGPGNPSLSTGGGNVDAAWCTSGTCWAATASVP